MPGVSALDVQVTQAEHKPDLNRFIATLRGLAAALTSIDRTAEPRPRTPRPKWMLEDLSHDGMIFSVRLTARPLKRRDLESMLQPVEVLVDGVRDLRGEPGLPAFYSEDTVETLLKVAKPHSGISRVALASVNGVVGDHEPLDDSVVRNARSAVRGTEQSIGSVTGMVTEVKGGKSGLRFAILDPQTNRTTRGSASGNLEGQLREAWLHRCVLRGRITRNSIGQALRISVTDIERLVESRDDRRVTQQLLGAAPEWTGGLSVDEFLAQRRGGG